MLKYATVNGNSGFDNVCKEKHVNVAYNNDPGVFEVSNITGDIVKYPVRNYAMLSINVAWDWEIQEAFFETYNIKPTWLNANYTWGWLDHVTNT